MAHSRGFRRGSSQRRPTFWEGNIGAMAPSIAGTNQAVLAIVGEGQLENTPNATVVRIRGSYTMSTAVGINGEAVLSVGIMLVNAPAFGAGVTSLPTPIADVGSDWIWMDCIPLDNVGVVGEPIAAARRPIDSKAMRKVGLNQVLVFVAEIVGVAGGTTGAATVAIADIVFGLRVLFKR